MDMLKFVGIGIIGAVAAMLLKEYNPIYSTCLGIITAVTIFALSLSEISYVLTVISTVSQKLSLDTGYIKTIIRIIGIAYISHFGSNLCRDAGQNTIAQKIELAGKLMIMTAGIPILLSVFNLLTSILPA